MAWYEIINAKSDSYIADRDAEDLLRQFATALQTEDGPAEAEVFYGLTSNGGCSSATTLIMTRLKFDGQKFSKCPHMIRQSGGHARGAMAPLGLDQS